MVGRPDSFMPLYIGDYLADTSHLSAAEHGAYLLLLMHYWRTSSPLADDDAGLMRIARMTKLEWRASRLVLRSFFRAVVVDGLSVLTHTRVEKELILARRKYDARSNAGQRGAAKRWQTDGIAIGKPDGKPMANEYQPQPQPHSSNEEKPPIRPPGGAGHRKALNGYQPEFDAFYAAFPKHVGRAAAEKAYAKARKTATAAEILAGAVCYAVARSGQDPTYTQAPAAWLNAGRWSDEIAVASIGPAPIMNPLDPRYTGGKSP